MCAQPADVPRSPREITSYLTNADSLSAILDVYKRHGSSFNAINVATAWNRLGKARATGRERAGFLRQEERALMQLLQHTERIIPLLDARNIAGACYGMARLRFEPAAATMRLLGEEATPRLGEFNAQGLANTAWAYAKLNTPAPRLFEAIAHESEQRVVSFKPQELANTAWAFATLGTPAPQLFGAIARASEQHIGSFKPQELANTAWAFATLGTHAPQLFDAIARESEQHICNFDEQGLANTAWAFAKLGTPAPQLFEAIARESKQRIGSFNEQGLANTAWAFAKLGTPAPQLLEAIARESEQRIGAFKPQELANTAWAFATLGTPAPQLFEAIARESVQRIGSFKPQGLANNAWAFATLNVRAPELFEAIARVSEQHIGSFKPQELANTAWAFATLGTPAPQLFDAIARESEQHIGSFDAQGLANTAWAFATLGMPAPQLFEAIARKSEQRIGSFNAQGLANTAWAFAKLGTPAPQLFDAIARESKQRIGGFKPQELANTAWAYATLGTPATQLFEAIARESEQRIGSFKPQGLANTAWAFAIAGTADQGALVEAVNARAAEIGLAAFGSKERRQLHQFFLGVELEASPSAELLAPIGLRDACRQAMADEKPARSSKLHEDVSSGLTRMGIAHANELCVPRLGYHVDIAISPIVTTGMPGTEGGGGAADQPLDEVAARAREAVRVAMADYAGIVIEVDGPTHYDDERRLRPASGMIRHHLALAGWAVLTVPYWEWNALKGQARKAYLAELLASANLSVAPRPSPAQPRAVRSWTLRTLLPPDAALPPGEAPAAGLQPTAQAAAQATRELQPGASRTAPDATGAASPPTRRPRVPARTLRSLAASPAGTAAEGGGSTLSAKHVVALLVEQVPGLAAKRGEALRAHLRSRDPFGLSWMELRCEGVGDRLAQKIEHELILLAQRAGVGDRQAQKIEHEIVLLAAELGKQDEELSK